MKMACGCPVITANATSIPEVAGDSVLYVDPYNVRNIAQKMHELMINQILRQELIYQGLERAQLFSWSKTAQDIRQILLSCLESATK